MSKSISDITVKTIDGHEKCLAEYIGNVLLIVNVASFCGYTSQYKGLEGLNRKYKNEGLRVLGFPCNDYGKQEPGSNHEIAQFCSHNFGVSFELFSKLHAKGPNQHPLYAFLTKAVEPPCDIAWNFEKFLVNKKGEVVAHFRSAVIPEGPQLVRAIEQELEA